jgi:hypothetical protein
MANAPEFLATVTAGPSVLIFAAIAAAVITSALSDLL